MKFITYILAVSVIASTCSYAATPDLQALKSEFGVSKSSTPYELFSTLFKLAHQAKISDLPTLSQVQLGEKVLRQKLEIDESYDCDDNYNLFCNFNYSELAIRFQGKDRAGKSHEMVMTVWDDLLKQDQDQIDLELNDVIASNNYVGPITQGSTGVLQDLGNATMEVRKLKSDLLICKLTYTDGHVGYLPMWNP